MQNTTPVMDRAEVERIAYQAIGHQFRLPSLFAMLVLVVGFVLGHYVAAKHTSAIAERFEARITALQEKVASLESGSVGSLTHGVVSRGGATLGSDLTFHDNSSTNPFDSTSPNFRLTGMSRTFEGASSDFAMLSQSVVGDIEGATTTRAVIDDLRKAAETERDACLAELQPYIDRKLSVPAATVVHVIETIYADQDRRLAAAVDNATAKATGISPRDTSVKIFPPSEDGDGASGLGKSAGAAASYRFFPKPASSRSLFFSPVGNPVPVPATSALDTESVLR